MKRMAFLFFTALLTVLFAVAMWQDTAREWTGYQRRFMRSLRKEERRGLPTGIRQLNVKPLGRVDRCTTCHVAIDRPQIALAEEPFTAHPGDYLTWHPPEQFGCTVCHGGQGLATEVKAAHGEVEHWEKPLLRGPLVQASCRKCHGDLKAVESHVPLLAQGIRLYDQLGCAGCHTVEGFGQTVSVDLSDIADKPWQLLDFTFVEGEPTLPQWILQHFKEPRKITPGFRKAELPPDEEEIYPTFMPNFGLNDQAALALTVYMLSLTDESLPARYVRPAPTPMGLVRGPARPASATVKATAVAPRPAAAAEGGSGQGPGSLGPAVGRGVERGQAVFSTYGCAGCHGIGGLGGRKNWNSQIGEEEPSLVYAKRYYDRDSLKQVIREGRQPVPRLDPARPRSPSYMPAWKDRISEPELDDLAEYLFSLADQIPAVGGPAAADTPSPAPPTADASPKS